MEVEAKKGGKKFKTKTEDSADSQNAYGADR